MQVPPSTEGHGNPIVAQFRAKAHNPRSTKDHAHTIPPMTMCFAGGGGSDGVSDVYACVADVPDSTLQFADFKGVSVAAVRGETARRHGGVRGGADRLVLVVRGKVTIMCDARELETIPVGAPVTWGRGRRGAYFVGFEGTETATLHLHTPNCGSARIGVLLTKPDVRNISNCATVLLD